ncbi:MAG: hypothetical protein ACOY46_14060 [Bacillota bacterium]
MTGMWILALGGLVLVFTVALALVPPKGGIGGSPLLGVSKINALTAKSSLVNALIWLCLPIPAIIALEAGLWRIRQGLKIREERLAHHPQTFWSRLGVFSSFYDIFNTGGGILFILLLFAGAAYELWHWPRALSLNTAWFAATILIYAVTRKKWIKKEASFSKWMRKGMPTYSLTEDGITIRLVTMWNKKRQEPPPVHIRFDEIDQLEVFTYSEADAYLKYKVGPDLELGVRQTRDFARYVQGKIPRPSVYAFGGAGSTTGKRVLIRGPELFYMVTFDTDDMSDLIEAYHSYKTPAKEAASRV